MNDKKRSRQAKRVERQRKEAKNVIKWLCIALAVLAVLLMAQMIMTSV